MLITGSDARAMCGGISRTALRRWRKELGFPDPIYLGARSFFDMAEVVAWIDAQRAARPRSHDKARLLAKAARLKNAAVSADNGGPEGAATTAGETGKE